MTGSDPVALAALLMERTRAAHPGRTTSAMEAVTGTVVEVGLATGAGITECGGQDTFHSLAATDERVATVDELQFRLNEGPGVQTCLERGVLVSGDLVESARWPRWGPAAAHHGFQAVVSVNLHANGTTLGAINLYSASPRQFTTEDLEMARLVGAHASIVLSRYRSDLNLWQAIAARHRIGQAQGILMERFHFDADKAFAVLRRLSQQQNIKLSQIADHVIATGQLPGERVPESSGSLAAD